MGSTPQSKLPLLQLNESNSTPGSSCWKSTADEVRRALETYGCLVVAYERSRSLQKDMFRLSEELFSLPLETKRNHTSQLPGFGYGGNYTTMPLFEYFGIEDGQKLEAAQHFARLMWPNGHQTFCETLCSYCKILYDLYQTVMKMVLSSYGLKNHYDPLMESSLYMMRIMKYKAPGAKKSNVGITPHRDKSFMTVIGTNEVEGLQIEMRDGQWVDFEPSPSKFIVIVGEPFMAWSNGRIYCPLHKVVARGIKEKYSIGLFSFIRGTLQVPKELVDDEHPLRFKAFSNLEFLSYCSKGGDTLPGAIQTCYGI